MSEIAILAINQKFVMLRFPICCAFIYSFIFEINAQLIVLPELVGHLPVLTELVVHVLSKTTKTMLKFKHNNIKNYKNVQ